MANSPSDPACNSFGGLAFLLAQVGGHSAIRFGERIASLNLTPPHVGILRVVCDADGLSQTELCDLLGIFPSRLVAFLDDLEGQKLIERRPNPDDRRSHALYATKEGRQMFRQIGRIGREHQQTLCAALNEDEQAQLAEFLRRIADEQKLTPGVHPGYRKLEPKP